MGTVDAVKDDVVVVTADLTTAEVVCILLRHPARVMRIAVGCKQHHRDAMPQPLAIEVVSMAAVEDVMVDDAPVLRLIPVLSHPQPEQLLGKVVFTDVPLSRALVKAAAAVHKIQPPRDVSPGWAIWRANRRERDRRKREETKLAKATSQTVEGCVPCSM